MICLAHRPDSAYDTSPHRQMLSRHEIARELALSRLTRDEVKQWLEAAFHRQQVGREFLAFLYRHTEGNPLFIAQLLRALVEDGAIWHNGTRWEWSPVSELRLPAGRAALIAQRLEQILVEHAGGAGHGGYRRPRVRRRLARRCGRRQRTGGAPRDLGGGHRRSVAPDLRTAPRRVRVRARRDRRRVWSKRSRAIAMRQLHARVAQALERRHPNRAGEIALHFDAAGETADAYRVGAARGEDGRARATRTARPESYLQIAGAQRHDARPSSRRSAWRSRTSPKPAADSTKSRSCATWPSSGSRDSRTSVAR